LYFTALADYSLLFLVDSDYNLEFPLETLKLLETFQKLCSIFVFNLREIILVLCFEWTESSSKLEFLIKLYYKIILF